MPTTGSLMPYIGHASDHERLAYSSGAEVAIMLDATLTGGQLTVIDTHSRRGDASPVHVHRHDDEVFLLLDGAMTVWVGDQRHELSPGAIAFLPRNIPHAVRCDMATRAFVLCAPAGHQESVFRAGGWDPRKPPPDGRQMSKEGLGRVAEDAGHTVIGPPHGFDD